jgi:cytochrome d ubiquinol oxidase subunit II
VFAFLAAVYLTLEAHDAEERAEFRLRALLSGVAVGVLALTVLMLANQDVRHVLVASPWAIPLHVATGVSAVAAFGFLWFERFRLARITAGLQAGFILWGWASAQYPYAIRPHLTLVAAAGPENVVVLLLQVLGAGAVLLTPSLLFLFHIFGPRGHRSRQA